MGKEEEEPTFEELEKEEDRSVKRNIEKAIEELEKKVVE